MQTRFRIKTRFCAVIDSANFEQGAGLVKIVKGSQISEGGAVCVFGAKATELLSPG